MSTVSRLMMAAIVGVCIAAAAIAEQVPGHRPTDTFWQMPKATWTVLEQAPGIVSGGGAGTLANIQVVFDANCPWSAKIYQYLKQKHPRIPVRWTPVAFMQPDSYALAAAIFASASPASVLDTDLNHYNFAARRGGYPLPDGALAPQLGPGQKELQQLWAAKWGGYTPMIFFRDAQGRIFQAQTDQDDVIDQVVRRAMQPLKAYH